jgi:hypothetical protein
MMNLPPQSRKISYNVIIAVVIIVILSIAFFGAFALNKLTNNSNQNPISTTTPYSTTTPHVYTTPTPISENTVITSAIFNGKTYNWGNGLQCVSIPGVTVKRGTYCDLQITVSSHVSINTFHTSSSYDFAVLFIPPYAYSGDILKRVVQDGFGSYTLFINYIITEGIGTSKVIINIFPSSSGYEFQTAILSLQITVTN